MFLMLLGTSISIELVFVKSVRKLKGTSTVDDVFSLFIAVTAPSAENGFTT